MIAVILIAILIMIWLYVHTMNLCHKSRNVKNNKKKNGKNGRMED